MRRIKCPKTITGKHKWIGGEWKTYPEQEIYGEGYTWPHDWLGRAYKPEPVILKEYKEWIDKECKYCGIIDDRKKR